MEKLKSILAEFNPVSLAEIDGVKLMNRIDRKYWFHISKLNELIESVIPFYDILEINEQRLMEYQSEYYDSKDNLMYLKHHNRKLNRYKVRRRRYFATDDDFLEIKLKTNKKRTVKERIVSEGNGSEFSLNEANFVKGKSPYKSEELIRSLNNQFYRITLIHKEKLDRCTIDIQPQFWNESGKISFDNLVIFELKRGRSLKSSPMVSLLRQLKIRQRGLSKYCTGRAMLDSKLKQNAFKPRLRFINNNILN